MNDYRPRAMLSQIKDELLGFGPIQPLLDDPTVSEVMVNRADRLCEPQGQVRS